MKKLIVKWKREFKMFELSILKDSSKGANSVLVASEKSNNPTELFKFAYAHEQDLFPEKPELLEYVTEAIEEVSSQYKNNKYLNKILKLNDEFQETEDEKTWEDRNTLILDLMQNKQICIKVLELLNIYPAVSINFKKVSE